MWLIVCNVMGCVLNVVCCVFYCVIFGTIWSAVYLLILTLPCACMRLLEKYVGFIRQQFNICFGELYGI